MRSNHCNVCKRPLKNPASIEAGMGPVCAAKNAEDNDSDQDDSVVVLTEPRVFDVVLSRTPDGVVANVPRSVIWHSPTGFEYGYGGSGPADLALNILNAFIPPGSDHLEPWDCPKGMCSATAGQLYQEFKRDIIAAVPPEGGTIKAETIMAWIDAHGHNIPTPVKH